MGVKFLIAGVQKGGTTALDDYLRGHPELEMATPKETHFFDEESLDWSSPDYRLYDRFFGPEDGRLRGEATPIYIYWPNSLERIRRYDPGMKLILLFRDPAERAWSHWRMEHDRGWDPEPFPWCIREGRRRVASDPAAPGHHRIYSYVERGFYGRQLHRVLGLFPREQLLLLKSEALDARPEAVLEQVRRFLGVAPFGDGVKPRRANVGRPGVLDPVDRTYLQAVYRDDLRRFAELSGLEVEPWLAAPDGSAEGRAQNEEAEVG